MCVQHAWVVWARMTCPLGVYQSLDLCSSTQTLGTVLGSLSYRLPDAPGEQGHPSALPPAPGPPTHLSRSPVPLTCPTHLSHSPVPLTCPMEGTSMHLLRPTGANVMTPLLRGGWLSFSLLVYRPTGCLSMFCFVCAFHFSPLDTDVLKPILLTVLVPP